MRWAPWACAFVLLCAALRFTLSQPFSFNAFFAIFLVLSGFYLAVLAKVKKGGAAPALSVIVLTGLAARLVLLSNDPVLSNDVYRYRWDGAVWLSGANPVATAPADPSLGSLAETVPLPPDHAQYRSGYPALGQAFFAVGAALGGRPWTFGLLCIALDMAAVLLLASALRHRGHSPLFCALLALHPLSIVESAHGAHLESLGVMTVCLFLLLHARRSRFLWISAALPALVKFWPVALVAPLMRESRSRVHAIAGGLLFAAVSLSLWAVSGSIGGLANYLGDWEFHSSLFELFRLYMGATAARILCALGFLGVTLKAAFFPGSAALERRCLWIVGACLLLSPTVHPWYALWLLPFLSFHLRFEWLLFSITVVSAYAVVPAYLSEGVWHEEVWPRVFTYAPLLAVFIYRLAGYAVSALRARAVRKNPDRLRKLT